MIKEAHHLKQKSRLTDLKTAINIWRERVPHQCESIQMWKEVLENRNFIQNQISYIICPVNPYVPKVAGQPPNPADLQERQG